MTVAQDSMFEMTHKGFCITRLLLSALLALVLLPGCEKGIDVTSVGLSETSISLAMGETTTLVATVVPSIADYSAIKWISSDPSSDASYHWYECLECHEILSREEHHALCDNPTECIVCGAEYSGSNIDHLGSAVYAANAEEHWQICSACDQEIDGIHTAHTPGEWKHDDEEHWQVCAVCGQEIKDSRRTVNRQVKNIT